MLLVVFLSTLRFDLEELADAVGVDSVDFVVAVVTVEAGEFIFSGRWLFRFEGGERTSIGQAGGVCTWLLWDTA